MSLKIKSRVRLWLGIALVIATIGTSFVMWWTQFKTEYVPPVAIPTVSQSTTTTSPTHTPTTKASSPTATPSPTPTVFPSPRGNPVRMTITQNGKVLVGMVFGKTVIIKGSFESECGKVGNYDLPGWPKPGQLSEQVALVGGHMYCGKTTYSINYLITSKAGAILRVEYSSGDVVVSRAPADAKSKLKTELNKVDPDPKKSKDNRRLYNASPAQVTRVATCDILLPKRSDGHAAYNDYQMFEQVALEHLK